MLWLVQGILCVAVGHCRKSQGFMEHFPSCVGVIEVCCMSSICSCLTRLDCLSRGKERFFSHWEPRQSNFEQWYCRLLVAMLWNSSCSVKITLIFCAHRQIFRFEPFVASLRQSQLIFCRGKMQVCIKCCKAKCRMCLLKITRNDWKTCSYEIGMEMRSGDILVSARVMLCNPLHGFFLICRYLLCIFSLFFHWEVFERL